jgi:hypothetical protein
MDLRERKRVPGVRVPGVLVPGMLVVALFGAAGCGAGDPAGSSPTVTTTPSRSVPGTATGTSPSTPSDVATTSGGPVEVPFPAGVSLAVVGVAHDDVLNVRGGPGAGFPAVATLGPQTEGVRTTGRGWRSGTGPYWIEVTVAGATGWASLGYLAGRDGTADVTAQVVRDLGSRPTAETMLDLGRIVAGTRASTEPRSRVVVSAAPTVGDLGEVSYDVVGLGDDAVFAERLHVFGQPIDSGEGFSLKSVEATSYCARGAPAGGLCP